MIELCICVTAKSCSAARGGGAAEGDGELIALRGERQDVAVRGLELKHHSAVTHQLQSSVPPRQCQFLFIKLHLLKHKDDPLRLDQWHINSLFQC